MLPTSVRSVKTELLPKPLPTPVSSVAIPSYSLSKLLLIAISQFMSNNFKGKLSGAYHRCYTPAKTRTPGKTVPQEHRKGQSQCWPAHLSVPMQVEPDHSRHVPVPVCKLSSCQHALCLSCCVILQGTGMFEQSDTSGPSLALCRPYTAFGSAASITL